MERLKVQIMNFNCTFGDMHDPLLSRFTDYFYPAITNYNERTYKQTKFVLNNISLFEFDGRMVLGGILVESKEIISKTKYNFQLKEVEDDNNKFKLEPVSYFGIFLDNHRMFYIKNQSESPSVDKFKSTISYSLKEYRKMKNKERKKGEEAWDSAYLNINVIPSTEPGDYKKIFEDAKSIEYLKFNLFTKNKTDIPGSFFDDILDSQHDIESNDPTLTYPHPRNPEKVGELIAESSGFAETCVKVVTLDGDKKKYINDDFQEQTEIDIPSTTSHEDKEKEIAKEMAKNLTLSKVTDFAKTEYNKFLPRIMKYYNEIIKR